MKPFSKLLLDFDGNMKVNIFSLLNRLHSINQETEEFDQNNKLRLQITSLPKLPLDRKSNEYYWKKIDKC